MVPCSRVGNPPWMNASASLFAGMARSYHRKNWIGALRGNPCPRTGGTCVVQPCLRAIVRSHGLRHWPQRHQCFMDACHAPMKPTHHRSHRVGRCFSCPPSTHTTCLPHHLAVGTNFRAHPTRLKPESYTNHDCVGFPFHFIEPVAIPISIRKIGDILAWIGFEIRIFRTDCPKPLRGKLLCINE